MTDNQLTALPHAVGCLTRVRKLMLASNRLAALPNLRGLVSLEMIRLSDNRLHAAAIKESGLLELPRLAWCALGGQGDHTGADAMDLTASVVSAPFRVDARRLTLGAPLGKGASGTVVAATLASDDGQHLTPVAVKLFNPASSDGRPVDELRAVLHAPPHRAIMRPLGACVMAGTWWWRWWWWWWWCCCCCCLFKLVMCARGCPGWPRETTFHLLSVVVVPRLPAVVQFC